MIVVFQTVEFSRGGEENKIIFGRTMAKRLFCEKFLL
jgi:hypothetical protein